MASAEVLQNPAESPNSNGEKESSSKNTAPNATAKELKEAPKRQNRNEKKVRKFLSKSGLKQLNGYFKIAVKRNNAVIFVINNPDVYSSPSGNIYVIFGETKVENSDASALQSAAEKLNIPEISLKDGEDPQTQSSSTRTEGTSPENPVDESGLNPKDIELVISQAGCSRNSAVNALRASDGDLVKAIISLTL